MHRFPHRLALAAALAGGGAGSAALAQDAADIGELETLLNQPVYAASKFAQDAADAPASVTVLTAGDIGTYGWRTLAEVLDGVRGVYLRDDHFYRYVGVRGLSRPGSFSSRLLVLIDGMRVNDNIYDQAGIGREFPLDVGLIERVEFIPGPGSALYGSNAVLGVVNIVTKSAAVLRGRTFEAETGSHAVRRASFTLGSDFDGATLVLGAQADLRPGRDWRYAEYDSPATNAGLAQDADRETDRKLYAKWSQGEWTLAGLLSQRRKQIPTGAFGTAFPSRDTSGTDRYAFADLQWQRATGDQQFHVRANLAQYDFQGRFDYGDVDGVQQLDQRGRWLVVEARWLYAGWASQRLMLGAEVQRNLEQSQRSSFEGGSGGTLADIEARSSRWGLFVNDEVMLRPGLRAVLGARFDRQLSGRHTATPRLALLWDAAPGLVVKLLDGRAYREPNAYESQYEDISSTLNPQLRSERLRASELALDWRVRNNLRLAASAYRYHARDLIEQVVDDGSGLLTYDNVGRITARGIELEGDYVAAEGWRARASWAVQSAHDTRDRGRIGNSPTVLGKLHLSVPLPALQARLGAEWQHTGSRLTLAGNRLPAHDVVNTTLRVAPPGARWSVAASVYNLLDRGWSDPGGPEHLQDALAQDGRTWRLQLALQF